MSLTIVVLAAGQGVRMNSDLPKVMHPLAGRPMVRFATDAARTLAPKNLIVVVGYRADLVRGAAGDGITFVTQDEQLGTGHAVYQGNSGTWLRFYDSEGNMVPTFAEAILARAEQEAARAEQEAARADRAEEKMAQLQAELERLRKVE